MKNFVLLLFTFTLIGICKGQNYPHYTMFMFNKLLYNPAYAGNKGLTTINVYGRRQWTGIDGAPTGGSVTIDGPIGSYMKAFRPVAAGFSVNSEKAGIVTNTNLMAYCSYRIKLNTHTTLSFGLQAGTTLYSADYSKLNPMDQNDPTINYSRDVSNVPLPNFGTGVYLSGKNYYAGLGIPFLVQNRYDKNSFNSNSDIYGKQVRTYFLSGGYIFTISPVVKLEPQVLMRYAVNDMYKLPFNADLNLSCFFYERFMIGATYRTDKSIEGVLFMQITNNVCIGYAYDYALSDLRTYNNGTHEFTVGFDFIKDKNKYMNPRFIKLF
ncbi:PorP/SprF family type IX secretion system membrane protein [Cytophaga aurantiaca]|uniref:PorP/SprF family type IX secretion system membrane protein n=1 Tax=Cytophaga aurantiaca TaxID=29530 RepID=UPI0003781CD5|nr:type IX secretion system membrane protein PorP/SprF [Cytophaga aurantiaca]